VCANVGPECGRPASRSGSDLLHGVPDDSSERPAPSCVRDGHARTWRHEDHGHAVGIHQQERDLGFAREEGIGGLDRRCPAIGERAPSGIRRTYPADGGAVHLLGGHEPLPVAGEAQRPHEPVAVLIDVGRIISHVRRKVEARVRP